MEDLPTFVEGSFDAREWVDLVLLDDRRKHPTRSTTDEEESWRALELRLQVARDDASAHLARSWEDLRGRVPRVARESRRISESASRRGTPLVRLPLEGGPGSELRKAVRRVESVERVATTLRAASELRQALSDASRWSESSFRPRSEDPKSASSRGIRKELREGATRTSSEPHKAEEEDEVAWMASQVSWMRRAVRATSGVSGFEDAARRVEEVAQVVLAHIETSLREAVTLRRSSELLRLRRAAKRCGRADIVDDAVVEAVAQRIARDVLRAAPSPMSSGKVTDGIRPYNYAAKVDALSGAIAAEVEFVRASLGSSKLAKQSLASAAVRGWQKAQGENGSLNQSLLLELNEMGAGLEPLQRALDSIQRLMRDVVVAHLRNHVQTPKASLASVGSEDSGAEGGMEEDGSAEDNAVEVIAWTVAHPVAEAWKVQMSKDSSTPVTFPSLTTPTSAGRRGTELLETYAKAVESAWKDIATEWFGKKLRFCELATDLADSSGLAKMVDNAVTKLAELHRHEMVKVWQTVDRKDASSSATALLHTAEAAAVAADALMKQSSLALTHGKTHRTAQDGHRPFVGDDGSVDLAAIWERSRSIEPLDSGQITGDLPKLKDSIQALMEDMEEAFIGAVGAPVVDRLQTACDPFKNDLSTGDISRVASNKPWRGPDGLEEPPSFRPSPQESVASAGEELLRIPEAIQDVEDDFKYMKSLQKEIRARLEWEREEGHEVLDAADGTSMVPWLAGLSYQIGEEDGGDLVASWSSKIAEHVAKAYAGILLDGVDQLSVQGASQLEADLEYFLNVIAALAAEAPPALITLRNYVSMEEANLQDALKAVQSEEGVNNGMDEDGPANLEALQLIARARGYATTVNS